MSTAVLLVAYGGPDSLDDLPAFIADVRHGRPTPPALLKEMTRRYALIGGRSPLLAITRRTAARLADVMGLPVYVGMQHWHPYIVETVKQMAEEGVTHFVAICMAPHYSEMSVGAYRVQLETAAREQGLRYQLVRSWHAEPHYLDGIAARVRETWECFPVAARHSVKVIFTAHSLPAALIERGDPYDAELHETACLIAQRLALARDRWMFCYQSAPKADLPWLGPQIEELVPQLAQQGEQNLLVAPIGFIADHVEVLYDLDLGVQAIARAHNVRVERTPMLNDSPALIAALAALAREQIGNLESEIENVSL